MTPDLITNPNIIKFSKPAENKRPLSLLERLQRDAPTTLEGQERLVKILREETQEVKLHLEPFEAEQTRKLKKLLKCWSKDDTFYRKGESQVEKIGNIEFEKVSEHPEKLPIIVTDISYTLGNKVEIEFVDDNAGQIKKEKFVFNSLDELKDAFSISVGGDEGNRNRLRNLVEPMFSDETLKMKP